MEKERKEKVIYNAKFSNTISKTIGILTKAMGSYKLNNGLLYN